MSFRADFPNKRRLTDNEVRDMLHAGPRPEWFSGPYQPGVVIDGYRYALVREYSDGTLEVEGYDTETELGIALWLQWRRARYTDEQEKRGYWVSYYIDADPAALTTVVVEP